MPVVRVRHVLPALPVLRIVSGATMMSKSVLICDDSLEELRVLVSMLKSASYRLIISNNGRDACSRASALQPDLILMDVQMPTMDGFAACRVLKAHDDTRHIPLIFLTAANELEDRLEGLRIGAVDYIVKPTDVEEILLRIGIHLRTASVPERAPPQEEALACAPPLDAAIVEAACRLLEKDLRTPPPLNVLAEQVGTHRHRLSAAFKASFGATVYAWLRERRMAQACEWLDRSPMSVQGIADELGFSSCGNFSTAFKERFGVNPSDYRRELALAPRAQPPVRMAMGD